MEAIYKADKMEERINSCLTLTLALKKEETKLFHMLLWQLLLWDTLDMNNFYFPFSFIF